MRVSRVVIKVAIVLLLCNSLYDTFQYSREVAAMKPHKDFKPGVYDVTHYVVNNDTLPPLITDSIRWKDIIIETGSLGSINSADTLLRKRYGRGYFNFAVDTSQPIIHIKKFQQDSTDAFTFRYLRPDSNTIQFFGKQRNDSLYIELKRSARHFQLAERQFHWLSEANR